MNILVVEDNGDLASLMGMWLELGGSGLTVRVRLSAEEVTDDDIDWAGMALVDYHLPDLDGCSLCHRIMDRHPGVRRILWSAAPPPVPCEHAHKTLVKPNSLEQIRAAINDDE